LLADLGAEGGGEAEEELGGKTFELPPGEDGLDLIQARGEAGEFLLLRGEEARPERFVFQALELVNLSLKFALPGDEGALGDMEPGGDAIEAPTPRAQFDAALAGFIGMFVHSLHPSLVAGAFLPARAP